MLGEEEMEDIAETFTKSVFGGVFAEYYKENKNGKPVPKGEDECLK